VEVSLAEIKQAEQRIRDFIYFSPCQLSADLSGMTGQQVYLKLDNLQRTGAFKERGALNRILLLTEGEKQRGVVAASAGNHAQAVAYHATQRGIRARIVMPLMTPLVKISATRGFGAEVILHGSNYDEACDEALRLCSSDGMIFLHPFDDYAVINGQGTIGLELLEQVPGLEAVVVPIGGGGLISGVACALKESNPAIRVVGVQTERLPSMLRAIANGGPITLPAEATIADGIAVRRAGELTLPQVQYRRKSSRQDYRARPGQRRPAGAHSSPPRRSPGSTSSADQDSFRSAGKHRRNVTQPCLLRCQFG